MKKITYRHKAREVALQILFQKEFLGEIQIKTSLEYFQSTLHEPVEVWTYCEFLVTGVLSHQESIDKIIGEYSAHWTLKRMALVDLNIMRVATFELKFSNDPTPHQVAIDEAVEIAKKYSTTDSGSFINGVLDQIHRAKV